MSTLLFENVFSFKQPAARGLPSGAAVGSHREASSRGKARDGAEVCASSSLLAVGRWGAKLTPGQLPPSRRWGLHPGFALHGSERWPDQDPFLG